MTKSVYSRPTYDIPEVRALKFPLDTSLPRKWFRDDQALSDFFHGLSLFFPDGERFFIDSVKAYLDQIEDPALRERVSAFLKQEAYHSREHERYNALLATWGYPVKEVLKRVHDDLEYTRKNFSNIRKLAITCALEHFTAVLADGLLSEPDILKSSDPVFSALWRWHAVEELEHKAVAFDVFQSVGGTTFQRNRAMVLTTIGFLFGILIVVSAMFKTDGISPLKGWPKVGKFMFVDHKMGWRILRNYVDYYRPGFHPWRQDNRHFIEQWNSAFPFLKRQLGWA